MDINSPLFGVAVGIFLLGCSAIFGIIYYNLRQQQKENHFNSPQEGKQLDLFEKPDTFNEFRVDNDS